MRGVGQRAAHLAADVEHLSGVAVKQSTCTSGGVNVLESAATYTDSLGLEVAAAINIFSPLLMHKPQCGSPCDGVDSKPTAMSCRTLPQRLLVSEKKGNSGHFELSVGRRHRLSQLKTTSWPSPLCTWTEGQVGSMATAAPRLGCPVGSKPRDLCWWWLSTKTLALAVDL